MSDWRRWRRRRGRAPSIAYMAGQPPDMLDARKAGVVPVGVAWAAESSAGGPTRGWAPIVAEFGSASGGSGGGGVPPPVPVIQA
jgi:hypothetical protein